MSVDLRGQVFEEAPMRLPQLPVVGLVAFVKDDLIHPVSVPLLYAPFCRARAKDASAYFKVCPKRFKALGGLVKLVEA